MTASGFVTPGKLSSGQFSDEMIRFGKNILETQPVMDQMNAIHWKARREKFRSAHEREINLYQMSKRILKLKQGVTEIRLSAWQQEKAELEASNDKLYQEYKPLKEKTKGIMEIKRQIDAVEQAKERKHYIEKPER